MSEGRDGTQAATGPRPFHRKRPETAHRSSRTQHAGRKAGKKRSERTGARRNAQQNEMPGAMFRELRELNRKKALMNNICHTAGRPNGQHAVRSARMPKRHASGKELPGV